MLRNATKQVHPPAIRASTGGMVATRQRPGSRQGGLTPLVPSSYPCCMSSKAAQAGTKPELRV
jgi:hypothetical protein